MSDRPVSAEQIDVTGDNDAAALILGAMADYVEDSDFTEKFASKGPLVEVTMTINGHPVPIVKSLSEAWSRCEADLEARARKMAIEMVTEAGLEPLAQALRDAETSIRNKLGIWDDR